MSCKVFHSFLATLLLSEKFLLGCSPPPYKFTMVSNGSVRSPIGSFAWIIIYGTDSEIHRSGHNTIAKGHSDLSSFCTEAWGYLGAL